MTVRTDAIFSRNSTTEDGFEEVPVTEPDRVEQFIQKANQAQSDWAYRPLTERRDYILDTPEPFERNSDEIDKNFTKEQGKPLPEFREEVKNPWVELSTFGWRIPVSSIPKSSWAPQTSSEPWCVGPATNN